jgi:hypothetical protein
VHLNAEQQIRTLVTDWVAAVYEWLKENSE